MRKLWSAVAAFLLLSGACVLGLAETADAHYQSPRTSPVVRKSTFLHGYLHGYEEGYSTADVDLQMARGARDPRKIKEGRTATGYRAEFGPRHTFEAGYHEGFRVGYADSIAGRVFRAVDVIQQVMDLPVNALAAADPPMDSVAPPPPRVPHASALLDEASGSPDQRPQPAAGAAASAFDEGFAPGYSSGQRRGLADARSALPFAAPAPPCPAAISQGDQGLESCAAYVRGFAMGYSDGYVNVARPADTTSAAQSK